MEKKVFATLFLVALAVAAGAATTNDRNRYSSAAEYMKHLYEEGTYFDGLPENGDGEAFSVWCLPDTDILQGTYRERPQSADSCTSVTRYVFSVSQLAQEDGRPIAIKKAMLRAYLQENSRLLQDSVPIHANIAMTARLFGSNSKMTTEETKVGFLPDVNLTPESSGWVEMELNFNEVFHGHLIQSDDHLELLLYLQADCNGMSVPASFADPAGFRSLKQRKKSLGLQPFLLVFSDDKMTGPQLPKIQSSKSKRSVVSVPPDNTKSTPTTLCQRQEFIINFEDIGLDYILAPTEVDIGYCSGLCSNIHNSPWAYLISSAQEHSDSTGSGDTELISFQCNPATYRSLYMISCFDQDDTCRIDRLDSAIVESCYCTQTGPCMPQ